MRARAWIAACVSSVLFACPEDDGTVADTTTSTSDAITPSDYLLDEEVSIEPAEATGTLRARAQAVIDVLHDLHAGPVFDAYVSAITERDGDCPESYTAVGDDTEWYGQCTTSGGASYSGYGSMFTEPDATNLFGTATVSTSDGRTLTLGGGAGRGQGSEGAGQWGWTYVMGAFAWDGSEADGTWLDDGVELGIDWWWSFSPGSWAETEVDGVVSGVAGSDHAVAFDTVHVGTGDCAGEPSGVVSVRGSDGWYDILFDKPEDDETSVAPSLCDGCGRVWYRGEEIGDVCLDFSSFYLFTEAPW